MSSTLDDHIRAALDRIRVSLSGQLEADLSASTSDILRAVTDEHRRALAEATEQTAATMRGEAEQQLAAAREEFDRERSDLTRQREELHRGSTFEIAGLERTLGEVRDELDAARRSLDDLQNAHEALEREAEQQRQDIERGRQELEQYRRDLEQHREDLEQRTVELEQSNHDLELSRQALERSRNTEEAIKREFEESIARAESERMRVESEREQARLDSESAAQQMAELRSRLAHKVRLTSAFRTLDESRTLSDILEHLAESACQQSGRTAVFLVNGRTLRGWRALGFPAEQPIVGAEFVPAETDVVGEAVRSGAGRQHLNGDAARLPAFAQADGPRDAVALPVQVGGSVIAVLYADAARADTSEDPEWLDAIDAMTKHAGRVLEAMTVSRAAALWTPRAGVVPSSEG